MNRKLLTLAAALALAAVSLPVTAAAQLDTPQDQRTFNYDPGEKAVDNLQKFAAETTYEDAVIVNHPIYGTVVYSKYRWKSWVTRALYLTLINIALLGVILSLPKNEEYNIILCYVLAGISSTMSFWIFLCAVLIFELNSAAWLYVLPVSLVTGAASYLALMKIKRSDISLSELKESFQRMSRASKEDVRLFSVNGAPGDWPDDDFVR